MEVLVLAPAPSPRGPILMCKYTYFIPKSLRLLDEKYTFPRKAIMTKNNSSSIMNLRPAALLMMHKSLFFF